MRCSYANEQKLNMWVQCIGTLYRQLLFSVLATHSDKQRTVSYHTIRYVVMPMRYRVRADCRLFGSSTLRLCSIKACSVHNRKELQHNRSRIFEPPYTPAQGTDTFIMRPVVYILQPTCSTVKKRNGSVGLQRSLACNFRKHTCSTTFLYSW